MPSQNRAKIVIYEEDGKFWWKLVARGKVVALAAQGSSSPHNARRAVEAFISHAMSAPIVDE